MCGKRDTSILQTVGSRRRQMRRKLESKDALPPRWSEEWQRCVFLLLAS